MHKSGAQSYKFFGQNDSLSLNYIITKKEREGGGRKKTGLDKANAFHMTCYGIYFIYQFY